MKSLLVGLLVGAAIILAPAAQALPGFCARHEDGSAPHVKGHQYIAACEASTGGGAADVSDADGDHVPAFLDKDPNDPAVH